MAHEHAQAANQRNQQQKSKNESLIQAQHEGKFLQDTEYSVQDKTGG
jgi:hypothetical protein